MARRKVKAKTTEVAQNVSAKNSGKGSRNSRQNNKELAKPESKGAENVDKSDPNNGKTDFDIQSKKRRNQFKEKQVKKMSRNDEEDVHNSLEKFSSQPTNVDNNDKPRQLRHSKRQTSKSSGGNSLKQPTVVIHKVQESNCSSPTMKANLANPKKPNINKLVKKVAEMKEAKDKHFSPEKSKLSPVKQSKPPKESSNSQYFDEKVIGNEVLEKKCKLKSPMKDGLHKKNSFHANKEDINSSDEGADDSGMEWEDVAEVEMGIPRYDDASTQGSSSTSTSANVEVTISLPGKKQRIKKSAKEQFLKWFERKMNLFKKENQISAHKVHLLSLLAIGLRRNNLCNNLVLQAVGLSLLPQQFIQDNVAKTWDIPFLMRLATWTKNKAPLPGDVHTGNSEATYLMRILEKKIYLLVVILRAVGLSARLVISLQTLDIKRANGNNKGKNTQSISPKAPKHDEKQKPSTKKKSKVATKEMKSPNVGESSSSKTRKKSKLDRSVMNKKTESEYFEREKGESSLEEEDFDVPKTPKRRRSAAQAPMNVAKKCPCKKGVDMWVEVYIEKEKKWICIDGKAYTVNQPEECEKHATNPLKYVVAFDNENSIKDVTPRYASGWLTSTSKLRVEPEWWDETMSFYKTKNVKRDRKEDSLIKASLSRKPLPTTVSEFKNHPLYALERHLLKFEAIYPETAATLGFCRGEAVYSRDCVHNLHTRELWMKEARVVKTGETPYKIVKGRKSRRKMLENAGEITAELFGRWQTEDYVPPPVVDGKIPRNEYGNVELFKPTMLPRGTCHIQLSGIHRLARKLNIEAVPAVVGFDFHCGFSHPVIDGAVVCEEYKETLIEAWENEQQEKIKREQQKREKRVVDNWTHLVRSLRIRERLKRKYNMEDEQNIKQEKKKEESPMPETEDVTDLSLSWPLNKQEGKTTYAGNGHCHVFLETNHVQDPVTGEWSKACSCGFKQPHYNN